MSKKYNETMIIRNGKLVYAVSLNNKAKSDKPSCYIYMERGRVTFVDSIWGVTDFDFNNENHRIAKEIFITELQTDIKRRILELKQLQSVFDELNLKECFGSVVEDNTKLLLEVKNEVAKISGDIKTEVSETIAETVQTGVKKVIKDTVKPIALRKEDKGK